MFGLKEEIEFAKYPLADQHYLEEIFQDKNYAGWYKYVLYTTTDEVNDGVRLLNKHIIIRLILPKHLPVYETGYEITPAERTVGLHRFLIGKPFIDKYKMDLDEYDTINEFMETLTDEDVSSLLEDAEKVVTVDCNKIPYLRSSFKVPAEIDIEKDKKGFKEYQETLKKIEDNILDNMKKKIDQHPKYIQHLIDVLNEKISVEQAKELSNGVIWAELKREQ